MRRALPTRTLYYRVRRCSRPLCSSQRTTRHPPHDPARPRPPTGNQTVRDAGEPCTECNGHPLPQDPTACLRPVIPHHPVPHVTQHDAVLEAATATGRTGQRSTLEHHPEHPAATRRPDDRHWSERGSAPHPLRGCDEVLLRKEVIQPHLPVRLPCYDFVPIADPTFDSSPPRTGWATGFGCYRLS